MPYDHSVFYHADVDGIFSAARFLDLFGCINNIELVPVYSYQRGEEFEKMIHDRHENSKIHILDYEFNSFADTWIDHHPGASKETNTLKRIKVSKEFNHKDKQFNFIYNSECESAFSLVDDYVTEDADLDLIEKIKNIMAAKEIVNKIDSASYSNLKWPFESPHPLNIIRFFTDRSFSKIEANALVLALYNYNFNLHKVVHFMGYDYKKMISTIKSSLGIIKSNMVINGDIAIISGLNKTQDIRYGVYYMYPEIKYVIKVFSSKKGISEVRVGRNPFITHNPDRDDRVNISIEEWIKNVPCVLGGAGGYSNIGAGTIKEEDISDFITDAVLTFYRKVEDMEKYSVDSSDPIEEKAEKKASKEGREVNAEDRKEAVSESSDENESENLAG